MTKKKELKTALEIAERLLLLMGSTAKAEASYDEANEAIVLSIDTETETGLLIGKRGETLSSFQLVLGMMLRSKLGDWTRVIVNVGDYREKQEDYLKQLAEETAQRAVETGEPQPLYSLTPAQRRIVHLELSANSEVETESQGEGNDRYLLVKPKGK